MNCRQCAWTPQGGCTKIGVCGKNEDIASLQEVIILGLKGISAYAVHARELGQTDAAVDATLERALYMTLTNTNFSLEEHLTEAMRVGQATVAVLDLLDRAHTSRLGVPQPITVSEDRIEGHCILVTGHNLFALEELLRQSEGKGVNVYTHSEMLPAHGYPGLRKYAHLKGNVGKAWYDQRQVFAAFPGAILVTTNCVMPIKGDYADRTFSYDVAGLEDVRKIENHDFSPLIQKALALPEGHQASDRTLTTGYHHQTVLGLAPQILDALKAGKVRRFFVIAGCDSPGPGGDYYRRLAQMVPKDCVILTTSCGKYRFNDLDFGEIEGLPRYIDLGQCNNSGSAVKIAQAMADALQTEVNSLPLSIVLSWFEQKAVAILLGLFSLGVKHIRIGPKPPEFVSVGVLKVLQEKFGLLLTGDPAQDLQAMLGEAPVPAST